MLHLLHKRIETSRGIIKNMLRLSQNPYLALSFGKDSLVMLDLVREQYQEVPCLFLKSEETYLLHEYEPVIEHYRQTGVNIEIVEMRHLNHDFEVGAASNEFQQPAFFRGWDGVFMGLRIEESKARRISIIRKESNLEGYRIMRYKGGDRAGMLRCCPVADWTAFEIMLYAKEKQLKMLAAYTDETVRTSAQLPFANVLQTNLQDLKYRNPSNYNRLLALMPELRKFT